MKTGTYVAVFVSSQYVVVSVLNSDQPQAVDWCNGILMCITTNCIGVRQGEVIVRRVVPSLSVCIVGRRAKNANHS